MRTPCSSQHLWTSLQICVRFLYTYLRYMTLYVPIRKNLLEIDTISNISHSNKISTLESNSDEVFPSTIHSLSMSSAKTSRSQPSSGKHLMSSSSIIPSRSLQTS